ncbi:MAG: hypothetical protein NXY59_08955 [Aigarchaeota archaeon]|nr:hypothetical protein [Candidatus Pelearchaeum maunauluense]
MVRVIWMSAITMAGISAILTVLILYLYLRALRFGVSRITLGHVLFAFLILAQSLIALASFTQLATRFGPEVGTPAMLISLAGLLAVGFLAWAAWQ